MHADLGALNKKDEAGKKPSCWFPNRTLSLALLGRAVFIVCIVMQMSLSKMDGSRAWPIRVELPVSQWDTDKFG